MAQIRACEVKIRLQQLKSDRWPFSQSGPLLESRLFLVSGLVEPFYFGKPDHSFVWSFWNCVNPGIDTWKPGHSLSSDLLPRAGRRNLLPDWWSDPWTLLWIIPLCLVLVLLWYLHDLGCACLGWELLIYHYGYILYRYVYMYILYINGL